jgi:glycosyltransferase involved in cell wall biosynthesis
MHQRSPVFTVIIPTYNQADLLIKALKSVINQTYENWEALVIDNYSEDNTKDIVENLHDCRIQYVPFRNQGVIAASRNRGITLSRGEYIAFLDSDDLWYPEKLSSGLKVLSQGFDAICHGMWTRHKGVLTQKILPSQFQENVFESLLFNGNSGITTSAIIIDKKMLEKFGGFSEEEQLVTAEDYDLWLRLSDNKMKWAFLSNILGEYYIHDKNASKNINKQMNAEDTIVLAHFARKGYSTFGKCLLLKKRRLMIAFRAGKRAYDSGFLMASLPLFVKGLAKIWA